MNLHVITDYILIVGFTCYVLIPFDRKRIRAPWARFVFVVSGLIGIATGVVGLMLDMRWLVLTGDTAYRVHHSRHFIGGLLLGFIFSLIFSGQLLGTKIVTHQVTNAPSI